jgi:hypothetical protein
MRRAEVGHFGTYGLLNDAFALSKLGAELGQSSRLATASAHLGRRL